MSLLVIFLPFGFTHETPIPHWLYSLMSGLSFSGVEKSFGNIVAVRDINLQFPSGKFVCLLGPSGCGKTTLLRLIAGLETPNAGQIVLQGKDITNLPAHKRNIGMVFQSHALFPHLTVAENIAYGMRIRKVDKAKSRDKVAKLLDLVRLPGVEDRHTSQLSGGQRQRVAMARALALEPQLFLLDEPLSALDANLREQMQVELRQIQQRLGITTILVTHDQREAMTMSDIVVVMDHGKVQQIGAPLDIYRQPANTFVATFMGNTNLLDAVVEDPTTLITGSLKVKVNTMEGNPAPGSKVAISIRPEEVHILPGDAKGENRRAGTVTFVRDVGASVEIYVDCHGTSIIGITSRKFYTGASQGDRVTVELPPEACVVLAS